MEPRRGFLFYFIILGKETQVRQASVAGMTLGDECWK